jgi:hypothetical protein
VAGKLVFTTIGNTYSWMLAGNQTDYAALWSLLIDKAARKSPVTESWSVASGLPMVNKPVATHFRKRLPAGAVKVNDAMTYPFTKRGYSVSANVYILACKLWLATG